MNLYDARNNLVDVLIGVVGESLTYDEVVSDLRLLMNDKTLANFSGINPRPLAQWGRLVSQLSELEAGLSSLTTVLRRHVGNKRDWPSFIAATEEYCVYLDKGRSGDGRFSTTFGRECLIQREQLRKQLHSLSSTYHDVSPARLERCLNSAMNTCHPNLPRSQVYPPVFSQGAIKSWAILLERTTQFNQYFDEKFLEILAENLSSIQEEPPPADQLVAMPDPQPDAQNVYISYAWKDSTPEGKRRGQLVDDLCQALRASGIKFLIDREQVNPGERISAFMKAITKGDMIIIVLSDRYLQSEFCMYELYGIWTRACQDDNLFLARVIPLALPDVELKTTQDFLARGEYWLSQKRDLDNRIGQNLDSVGPLLFDRYKLIKQFAEHATEMLLLLLDKHEPCTFESQFKEGFREVVAQILAARSN